MLFEFDRSVVSNITLIILYKHNLYAVDSDGIILCDNFTFANSVT